MLAPVLLVLLASQPHARQAPESLRAYQGTVVHVVDGDTVRVRLQIVSRTGRTRIRNMNVRLYGVDAPEKSQTWGDRATDALRRMTLGREVEVRHVTGDSYGRAVALLYVEGMEVNAALVEAGHAWAYRKYLGKLEGDERYCGLEYQARGTDAGLWGQRRHGPPWAYRHGGEGRQRVDRERGVEGCVANFEAR